MKQLRSLALIAVVFGLAAACSSASSPTGDGSSGADGGGNGIDSGSGNGNSSRDGGSANNPDGAASNNTDSGFEHPDAGIPDPTLPGPYAYAETDSTYSSPVNASSIAVHVAYPTGGPTAGPYPVIVMNHGFLIDPSEYYSYLQRAASFGYVAIAANYPVSTSSTNYPNNVTDILGGVDWLASQTAAPLAGIADTNTVGMSGHSLGGKLAILAAAKDSRVKAALTFDAVDGSNFCLEAADCPNASAALPLPIPTGFLGEILDSTAAGGFSQACAPAATNYATIYANAGSPSFEVTVTGAGHVSFLDDVSACGAFCSFCATPTVAQAVVLNISHGYLAAFYERYLRNNTAYDTYLTGALATELFVDTNQATIISK